MQLQFLAPVELFFKQLHFLTRAELFSGYTAFPAVRFVMSTLLSRRERSTISEDRRLGTVHITEGTSSQACEVLRLFLSLLFLCVCLRVLCVGRGCGCVCLCVCPCFSL